jgi:predicted ATP-grasp superfamily ATP-dependent carboligase
MQESQVTSPRTPALLCDATFYGTLAAVRSLGRAGIPVDVVHAGRAALASWSKYATRRLRGPEASTGNTLVEWLMEVGHRDGRRVIYPTSDEMVFLLSAHRARLEERFLLLQPDLETTLRVLDKKSLHAASREAGVETPETWFPDGAADALRVARNTEAPLMFKPRTQLFLTNHIKGALAPRDPTQLREAYETFRTTHTYGAPIAGIRDDVTAPMLQRYYPEAADGIYSLTGFRDRSGKHLALLGSTKVLQRPRRLGIGLCFESAQVPEALERGARKLLDVLGYFGVFELEFIVSSGRYLLIDMNPRFYNHLQLDVSRGLDLPMMAYAAAVGDDDRVAELAGRASKAAVEHVFCNRIGLGIQVTAQRLFGTMPRAEAKRWREWTRARRATLVDPISAADDRAPIVAESVSQLYGSIRHPRAFLRMIALDR